MSDPPLNQEALGAWLEANVEGFTPPFELRKFPSGQSNPTYRITAASGLYVLRRKPPGPLLPSAHAVDREYRVLAAVSGTGVPVARVHALCNDDSVLGSAFYVMDFVDGRIFWDQRLPTLSRTERAAVFDSINETIARLHAV